MNNEIWKNIDNLAPCGTMRHMNILLVCSADENYFISHEKLATIKMHKAWSLWKAYVIKEKNGKINAKL